MSVRNESLAPPLDEHRYHNAPELPPPTIDEIKFVVNRETGWAPLAGGDMSYSRFEPEHVENMVPIIIVPGYAGIEPAYENLGYAMAFLGRREAYTLHPVRRHKLADAIHPAHLFNPLRLPGQAVYAVMRVAHDYHGSEIFDLYCHSMGGPTGVGTALTKPELVRAIDLVGSAGLDGHNALSLGLKLPGVVVDIAQSVPQLDIDPIKAARHITEYVFSNIPRTVLEAAAVSRCDIRPGVGQLRMAGKIVVRTQFIDDPFFPARDVNEHDITEVDDYALAPGGHLTPITQPIGCAALHHTMTDRVLSRKG